MLSVLLEIFVLLSPFYMQLVVDEAILKGDRNLLVGLSAACALLYTFKAAANPFRSFVFQFLGTSLHPYRSVRPPPTQTNTAPATLSPAAAHPIVAQASAATSTPPNSAAVIHPTEAQDMLIPSTDARTWGGTPPSSANSGGRLAPLTSI